MYVIYNTSIRCWYFRAISARPPRKLRIHSPSCDDDIKSDSTLSTVYYKYQLLHLLIHLEHPINQVYNKKRLSQLRFWTNDRYGETEAFSRLHPLHVDSLVFLSEFLFTVLSVLLLHLEVFSLVSCCVQRVQGNAKCSQSVECHPRI